MGQMEFRAARNEGANGALWTGFAEGATDNQVRHAVAFAHERLVTVENAHYLVTLQAIHALSARGLSTRDIASVIGISKSAVSRHLRLGVEAVAVGVPVDVTAIVRQAWSGE
jgi:DNA-binding NarL/FixJ family response regulator